MKIGEWPKYINMFVEVLSKAQELRGEKNKWIESDNEIEWMQFERQVMFDFTNEMRLKNGLSQITMEQIKKIEQTSVGFVDYTRKFALGCAELSIGQSWLDRQNPINSGA